MCSLFLDRLRRERQPAVRQRKAAYYYRQIKPGASLHTLSASVNLDRRDQAAPVTPCIANVR
jgi:hypothetical protein